MLLSRATTGRCQRAVKLHHFGLSQPVRNKWQFGYHGHTMFVPHRKGFDYEEPDIPFKERLVVGNKIFLEECKLWLKEQKHYFTKDMWREIAIEHDELKLEWPMFDPEHVKQWSVTCDADHNAGFSKAELIFTPQKTALFRGCIDTTLPKDGKISRTGYANISPPKIRKSFFRQKHYDWDRFTHVAIKCRGDGRRYQFQLRAPGTFDFSWFDQWQYYLFTHGGPYWQYERIPLSKFMKSAVQRIQDKQHEVKRAPIQGIGITMADTMSGPFQLEIAWIGLLCDRTHFETFAWYS